MIVESEPGFYYFQTDVKLETPRCVPTFFLPRSQGQAVKNPDAAWIFMQWVCSPDVMARVSTLGGGASPMRLSAFKDPRVLAAAKVGPGTTRHFPAIEWTINNAMGSEPDMPAWAEISNNVIPVELGKLLAGQYSSPEQCMEAIKTQTDELAAPFRKA